MGAPLARITARSITLRSSRMLPGQLWRWSSARAAGEIGTAKALASPGKSSFAVRSAKSCASAATLPGPLAQRRDDEGHAVQPEIQVLPERAAAHLGLEVAVRGRDEADVDLDGGQPADPHHLSLLDDPEELGLDRGRQLADLVEEHGALSAVRAAPASPRRRR